MNNLLFLLYLLVLSNLALTGFLLHRATRGTVRERRSPARLPSLEWEEARRNFNPIIHQRVTTKPTKVSTKIYGTTLTYWAPKDDPGAVPFVAMFFKDSGIFDGVYVPGESYFIPDTNKILPAASFEENFEQAEVAVPIPLRKSLAPSTNNGVVGPVTSKSAPVLSDEDADALAREYELG